MTETSHSRSVLKVTGDDRESFLQGLVTNDVGRLKQGLVYTALLSPQGKYLADFFLVPATDAILIDVASDLAAGLMQRLSMYKLRAAVSLEATDIVVSRGVGTPPDGGLPDPRNGALGWRAYGDTDLSDDTDWDAIRVANLVPETGVELHPDSYILECRFEDLNGVDFKKGCYVGQEVTARMKHKTELRKGLARVSIDGAVTAGSEITADGKPAGTLHTVSGGEGIAYLRFDRAKGEMAAGDAKVVMVG